MGFDSILRITGERLDVPTSAAVKVKNVDCVVLNRTANALFCTLAGAPSTAAEEDWNITVTFDGFSANAVVRGALNNIAGFGAG